jgi:predicted restriction endonuclease
LDCNTIIRSVSTRCRRCYTKFRGYGENPTLGEVEDNHNHRASAYSIVRIRARVIAKKNNMNFCIACGYNKHVEICHIKPTSSFNKNTRLSVINSLDNLVSLCRNCHWEFDNGLLKLKKA